MGSVLQKETSLSTLLLLGFDMPSLSLNPDAHDRLWHAKLHLISAFLAMEPISFLISLAKQVGRGNVDEEVQGFVLENCISVSLAGDDGNRLFLRTFLKKMVEEIELSGGVVLDELYEQCGLLMAIPEGGGLYKGRQCVCKRISFFPDGAVKLNDSPFSSELAIPLRCSLNMLEGDTGCSIWPSSLYLSEFILSFPEIFINKSCFEIGAGVGLVGLCLSQINVSSVILSDGDLSTLSNLKSNLDMNNVPYTEDIQKCSMVKPAMDGTSKVHVLHLPWESASETKLQQYSPNIILAADVIYDPVCLPDLVRVIGTLLTPNDERLLHADGNGFSIPVDDYASVSDSSGSIVCDYPKISLEDHHNASLLDARRSSFPVAYIASVIRNADTFNYFVELAMKANLVIKDVTEESKPLNLLPYMRTFDRSNIRLFKVTL